MDARRGIHEMVLEPAARAPESIALNQGTVPSSTGRRGGPVAASVR